VNRGRPTQQKREREKARRERQQRKQARNAEAKARRAAAAPRTVSEEDPDIAGIRPGPQPSPWED
jgi:hypothetical protein